MANKPSGSDALPGLQQAGDISTGDPTVVPSVAPSATTMYIASSPKEEAVGFRPPPPSASGPTRPLTPSGPPPAPPVGAVRPGQPSPFVSQMPVSRPPPPYASRPTRPFTPSGPPPAPPVGAVRPGQPSPFVSQMPVSRPPSLTKLTETKPEIRLHPGETRPSPFVSQIPASRPSSLPTEVSDSETEMKPEMRLHPAETRPSPFVSQIPGSRPSSPPTEVSDSAETKPEIKLHPAETRHPPPQSMTSGLPGVNASQLGYPSKQVLQGPPGTPPVSSYPPQTEGFVQHPNMSVQQDLYPRHAPPPLRYGWLDEFNWILRGPGLEEHYLYYDVEPNSMATQRSRQAPSKGEGSDPPKVEVSDPPKEKPLPSFWPSCPHCKERMSAKYNKRKTELRYFFCEGCEYPRGSTAIGITTKEGVVLAVEKPITLPPTEKIVKIDDHIICVKSGGTNDDFCQLVDHARQKTRNHRYLDGEPMTVESTTQIVCNLAKVFNEGDEDSTRSQPFGVSLLIAGHDENGSSMYYADPSGIFWQCNAKAIGFGSEEADKSLDELCNKYLTLQEAETIAVSVLKQVMKYEVTPKKVEIAKIVPAYHLYTPEEVEAVMDRV